MISHNISKLSQFEIKWYQFFGKKKSDITLRINIKTVPRNFNYLFRNFVWHCEIGSSYHSSVVSNWMLYIKASFPINEITFLQTLLYWSEITSKCIHGIQCRSLFDSCFSLLTWCWKINIPRSNILTWNKNQPIDIKILY